MSNPDEWQSRMAGEYSGIGFDQDVAGGKTWKINTQLRLNDPRLVKLNVGYNTVGAEGALLLAQGLRYNTTLISCVAAGIDAGDRGAASFGAALTTNRTLVSLDLGLNDIAEEGAHKLGRGLAQNATLTHLSLAGNELQERGVRNLAPHLARHASLTALDLRANDSKPAAAIALAEALAGRNTMLTSLDLRANRLGSTGTMALLACVAQNGVLRRLDLCENGVGADVLSPLAEALERRPYCFGGAEEVLLRGNRGLPDVSDTDSAAGAALKRASDAPDAPQSAHDAFRCWRALQTTRNALRVSRERLTHVLASTPLRGRSCSEPHWLTALTREALVESKLPDGSGRSPGDGGGKVLQPHEALIEYFRAMGDSEQWFAGVVTSLQIWEAREGETGLKCVDRERWERIPRPFELLCPQREPFQRRGLGENDTWALAHEARHQPKKVGTEKAEGGKSEEGEEGEGEEGKKTEAGEDESKEEAKEQ